MFKVSNFLPSLDGKSLLNRFVHSFINLWNILTSNGCHNLFIKLYGFNLNSLNIKKKKKNYVDRATARIVTIEI
jgi:hypothetical protein